LTKIKVALAQINPIVGDFKGNLRKHLDALKKGEAAGARLVVFSELSLIGYLPRDLLLEPHLLQNQNFALHQLTQAVGDMYVLCGVIEKNPTQIEKPLFNTLVCLHKGQIIHRYHKRLLPTYDVFDERRYFEPGTSSPILEIEGFKIGLSICEDIWQHLKLVGGTCYAQDPVADLMTEKLDLFINISGSPYYQNKIHTRIKMVQGIVKSLKCPMIYVNQVGANDGVIFDGYSMSIAPHGDITFANGFTDDLLLSDENRPLPNFSEDLEKSLVLGIRDYVVKNGFSKVVLGLSGGIDSALVLDLCVRALGSNQVHTLYLPSKFSSPLSLQLAQQLAKNYGVKLDILPIESIVKAYLDSLDPTLQLNKGGLALENLQARIRGNMIMAYSNKWGLFMMGCSNKSELAVGYGTLYGDIAGALLPIGDLYKKEVYRLAKRISQGQIPEAVFSREPTAELALGQKDSDTLPPYEILDEILEAYIEGGKSKEALYTLFPDYDSTVDQVLDLFKKAEFKRYQCPIILKTSTWMFGRGWDWPITRR